MTTRDILMAAAEGGDVPIVRSEYFSDIVPGVGKTKTPPTGAAFMRVALVGAGGSRGGSPTVYGGAGGGCAATKIVPASTITYTLDNLASSTATFSGYSLTAGKGSNGGSGTAGGSGTGGDYNFTGGARGYGGGGAAGPNGDGNNGSTTTSYRSGYYAGTGWGPGGGFGGSAATTTTGVKGGSPGTGLYAAPSPFDGMGMGGGSAPGSTGTAGDAGLVVEYFYTS